MLPGIPCHPCNPWSSDSRVSQKRKRREDFHVSAPVLTISLVFWVEVLAARRAVSQAALGSKEISYPGDPLIF
jgi:hypothetical protein